MKQHFRAVSMLGMAIFALLPGCGEEDAEAPAASPPPVEVLVVREQPVIPRFNYVGRVEATDEYQVIPRVEGYIRRRYFQEGSMVRAGDLLYEIDPQPFMVTLENRRAAVASARSALDVAERNYRRGRELVEKGAISQMTMDDLTGTFEQAEAALKEAQANVAAAELDLSYTRITAPFTGRIGRSAFPEGALVGPTTDPLTSIVNMNPIFVLFEVPQDRLFAVQIEMGRRAQEGLKPKWRDIRIQLPDGSFYDHRGVIAFVDNQINPATGSVPVRARFDNPDQLLVQGQFVQISIRVYGGAEDVLPLVPQAAVLEDMQGRYVFVLDDKNIARTRYLELGQREGELWAVEKGLKAGERVIVNGLQRVVADKPVTPQDTQRIFYQPVETPPPPPESLSPLERRRRDGGPPYDNYEVYDGK